MELTDEVIKKAIAIAQNARSNAFSFRSNHPIGACIITTEGRMYGGCNTENTISGLGVCAERSAMDHAVVNGQYEFAGLVVIDGEKTFPCGSCLQYLELFSQVVSKDIPVIVALADGTFERHSLHELLPDGYKTKHYLDVLKSFKNRNLIPVKDDESQVH